MTPIATHPAPAMSARDDYYTCNYDNCCYQFPPEKQIPGPGSFCCYQHRAMENARHIILDLEHDHRYCSNCYRKCKDVYPPGRRADSKHVHYGTHVDAPEEDPTAFIDDIPDAAIGRAYPRNHCIPGVGENFRRVERDPREGGGYYYAPSDDDGRVKAVCSCGVTNHRTVVRPLSADRIRRYARHLSDAADDMLREGKRTFHHNRDAMLEWIDSCYLQLEGELQREAELRALAEGIMAEGGRSQ